MCGTVSDVNSIHQTICAKSTNSVVDQMSYGEIVIGRALTCSVTQYPHQKSFFTKQSLSATKPQELLGSPRYHEQTRRVAIRNILAFLV